MPVPAISEVPLETLGEILVKILLAMESEFSSIQTTLSSIPGIECRRFCHVAARIQRSKLVQALSNVVWAAAAIPAFLVMFDVRPDYQWWLTSLCVFSLPGLAFVSSCFNRKVVAKLLTTFQPTSSPPFQPVYILFWILVMFGALAALWRKHPAKVVSLVVWLPSFMMATLVDADPEVGRTLTSRYERTIAACRFGASDHGAWWH
jgi:hypothetical protein